MKRSWICCMLLLFTLNWLPAQEKKQVEAFYISVPLTIDGIPDEEVYAKSKAATDFVQLMPYNGKPAYQPSEVHIFYDQTAIYVGAILYDSSPDSIFNFYSERDNIGFSDYFGIYFDPYNQGQLAYGFFITPAGIQTDLKAIKREFDNEESNWNAVWQSKTRITDKGWVVEMRIPYSALRFPENGGGTWGMNMFRNIRRYASNSSWNFVDRNVSGFIHQEGEVIGIHNIKPPVRLSLSPYVATYTEFTGESASPDFIYKGGLDLKYGISESFTLDMMLIPDFGQIQSDDKQLNLSPYELYYSERRQFFTEGTELFERGDIFYSRRIGAGPKFASRASDDLKDHEIVDYNPTETQLLNATKVSGRTTKGWGLGLLNAMTLPSHATLKDTISGNKRDILIQPFTNYNVMTIDKSLKNNSYVSLINSNMLMANDPFSANVTATDFQIRNKAKTFAVKGKAGVSSRNDGDRENGYYGSLGLSKNSGKLQYGVSQVVYSDKFNPNDMGYLRRNNEMSTESYVEYNITEPFSIFKEMYTTMSWEHIRTYKNSHLFGNEISLNSFGRFTNNYGVQINLGFNGNTYDYYEPRVMDRYYFEPAEYNYGLYSFSDYRKPLYVELGLGGSNIPDIGQHETEGELFVNLRIGKRYQLYYSTDISNEINGRGFVEMTDQEDTIYFARRNIKTIESVLGSSFVVSNKAGFDLRIRHYWSGVLNKEYYQLQSDGGLISDPTYVPDKNENYNVFNIDLVFRWIFAPGSELTLAWKNSIQENKDVVVEGYLNNLRKTWQADQTNSLSVKLLYYIDYNNLRRKK